MTRPLPSAPPAWILAIAVLLGSTAWASPPTEAAVGLPPAVHSDGFNLKRVGGNDLTLFRFRIYHASLWSDSGTYRPDQTLALNLLFQRDFTRGELVDITVSAWRKLDAGNETKRDEWASQLTRLWQDVGEGDSLTGVVLPGGETRFYNQQGLLGVVADAGFGPAYLGIWLDERTQLPELRAALLGMKKVL